MPIKELLVLLVVVIGISEVTTDGYGHGGHAYMVPTGDKGGGKWSIRAKGKGMQNMMQMHYPKHDYKKEDKKEIVYYPVPVYQKPKEYKEEYSKKEAYHDYSEKKEHHMEYPKKEEYKQNDEYHHDHHKGHESAHHGLTIIPIYIVPHGYGAMNGAYGDGGYGAMNGAYGDGGYH